MAEVGVIYFGDFTVHAVLAGEALGAVSCKDKNRTIRYVVKIG